MNCTCHSGGRPQSSPGSSRGESGASRSRLSRSVTPRRPCTCVGGDYGGDVSCRCAQAASEYPCSCSRGGTCTCQMIRQKALEICSCQGGSQGIRQSRSPSPGPDGKSSVSKSEKEVQVAEPSREKGDAASTTAGGAGTSAPAGAAKEASKDPMVRFADRLEPGEKLPKNAAGVEKLIKSVREQLAEKQEVAKNLEKQRITKETAVSQFKEKLHACKADGDSLDVKFKKEKEETESALTKQREDLVKRLAADREDFLSKLEADMKALEKKLRQEYQITSNSETSAKKKVGREKQSLSGQASKVEKGVVSNAAKLKQSAQNLSASLKLKDKNIRSLSACTWFLQDSMVQKELANKKLEDSNKDMRTNFIELQFANHKLSEDNTTLSKHLKNFQNKTQSERMNVQKLTKQCVECSAECALLRDEIHRLNEKVKQLTEGSKELKRQAQLEQMLKEAKEREDRLMKVTTEQNDQMQEMEGKEAQREKSMREALRKIRADQQTLQKKFADIQVKFDNTVEKNRDEIAAMEGKFRSASAELRQLEDSLTQTKLALEKEFEDLEMSSRENRDILEGLIIETKGLDAVLKKQKDQITATEAQIAVARATIQDLCGIVQELTDNAIELNDNLAYLEQMCNDIEASKRELGQQIEVITKKIERTETMISQQKANVANMKQAVTQKETAIQSLQEQIKVADKQQKGVQSRSGGMRNKQMGTNGAGAGDARVEMVIETLEKKTKLVEKMVQLQTDIAKKQRERAMEAAAAATAKYSEVFCIFFHQVEMNQKLVALLERVLEEKENDAMCETITPKSKQQERPGSSERKGCKNPSCTNSACGKV